MTSYFLNDLEITLDKKGLTEYTKVSYPVRYGCYSEIKTPEYLFQFNLNGEIEFIQGLKKDWPDPSEWLKRTQANDWVYYSTGGYSGVYDAFGEYYLPCPSYSSNALTLTNPFDEPAIQNAVKAWHEFQTKIPGLISEGLPLEIKYFLGLIQKHMPKNLKEKAEALHRHMGGPVSVLPPDTRHVDYDVIPIHIADGCLYHCGFCRVKSKKEYSLRTRKNIKEQIRYLKEFHGRNLINYNSLFLGQHDALYASPGLIEFAAEKAFEDFKIASAVMKKPSLFLFGSVDSLLKAKRNLFDSLERLPFSTYINIGLESADSKTLGIIKKSITSKGVSDAFGKAININREYKNLQITANFLFGDHLPESHLPSIFYLMNDHLKGVFSQGALYFSPLADNGNEANRGMVRKFYKIKARSLLSAYLYLIQRA